MPSGADSGQTLARKVERERAMPAARRRILEGCGCVGGGDGADVFVRLNYVC